MGHRVVQFSFNGPANTTESVELTMSGGRLSKQQFVETFNIRIIRLFNCARKSSRTKQSVTMVSLRLSAKLVVISLAAAHQ